MSPVHDAAIQDFLFCGFRPWHDRTRQSSCLSLRRLKTFENEPLAQKFRRLENRICQVAQKQCRASAIGNTVITGDGEGHHGADFDLAFHRHDPVCNAAHRENRGLRRRYAAITVDVTCGAVNCEHDSLNPVAALSPMWGMWVNCIYGGKGVGMINLLLFLIIGVFLAGQMVGRTPEYLGRKIGAREVKLAVIALLVHPLMILGPTGVFAATDWGTKAESNPGAHGFSQIVYQFSSASANNGSAFDGLGVTYGFNNNPNPAPEAKPWDIATGLVMLFSRYLPIVAPMAMAAALGYKKETPFGLGTLRDNTFTFGCLLFGTIVILGALLFLPVAALGPLADHLGPIPFGG